VSSNRRLGPAAARLPIRFAPLAPLALLALLAIGSFPIEQATARGTDRYIVVLKDGVASPAAVAHAHGRAYGLRVSHVYGSAIKGYAATLPTSALERLREDPRVASISPDRPMGILAQTKPTGIRRIAAPKSSTAAGDGVGTVGIDVAVIDTGIDLDHPDLNVMGGINCSTGNSHDDGHGHGTHVAGTIGARDNAIGVVGVAPGARLWSVRVLSDSGSGTDATVLCGVDWVDSMAPANGGPIRVANMSLGGGGGDDGACGRVDDDPVHAAICEATADGVLFVVSAGNSRRNIAGQVPAAYNEVLTVSAVADFNGQAGGGAAATCRADVDDTAADFSNFTRVGSADEAHVIAAPGVCIKSTWKGGGYRRLSGTSMASPHVAGAAALCLGSGRCAGLSPAELLQKLRTDAAARPASYGYAGDPTRPIFSGGITRFYGFLVYVGGY
jgi:subtilisin